MSQDGSCNDARAGSKSGRRRTGAISLEFALILPLYAMIITSTLVAGVKIYQTQQYSAMAKFLARKAIVRGESADKLGPWGPQTMYGSIGDGSVVGTLLADKYNNGKPLGVYFQLVWPDGGNSGLRNDRVEVTISSARFSESELVAGTIDTSPGLGAWIVSASVTMVIAH
jgi:hypothetical protein